MSGLGGSPFVINIFHLAKADDSRGERCPKCVGLGLSSSCRIPGQSTVEEVPGVHVNTTAFSIICYVFRNLRGFKKASCHCRFTLDAGAAVLSGTAFFHRMLMKAP